MSSIPRYNSKINPAGVWRDALGPGYAVGVGEGLLRVAGAVAARPYRAGR